MRSVESEGATIDQAIDRALHALGAERNQVEVEILASGTRGLFGFGRTKARIRATMRAPLHTWLEDVPSLPSVSESTRETDVPPSGVGPPAIRDGRPVREEQPESIVLLQGVLQRMGLSVDVELTNPEGSASLPVLEIIAADTSGDVIGRDGEVLDALEYVLNRMLERRGHAGERVLVDAGGYRGRRRAKLASAARRLAERARQRRRAVAFKSPLSPVDQRTIQETIRSERDVSMRTVGQGFYRKVVIVPREARRAGGRDRE